ncbi:MAG TPA: c-type cytochrome [Vicinamibacterales bacterium]|nr:c-type cytochrome [Vicinamibacterales bacterium]
MKQRTGALVLAVACFALGVVAQRMYDVWRARRPQLAKGQPVTVEPVWTAAQVDRSTINFPKQPFWAWGVTEPPKPSESQAVQFAPGVPPAAPTPGLSPEESNQKRHVEGSRIEFSIAEVRGATSRGGIVDWFPEDHPNPVPDIIAHGPAALGKDAKACGLCHLSDGSGRPENASPAGMPAAYIVRQMEDFKNNLRHSSDPRKGNSNTMVMLAKATTAVEMRAAAEYFAAVKWRPHVRVIETDLVPNTRIQGELFIPTTKELTEPIGKRIIEVPADVEANQTLRNSRGTWIAYVPIGAIQKGRDLVTLGGMKIVNDRIVQGKTTACGTCHGIDLMGVPPDVPPLAGRSPSYMAREIFDIQQGARKGSNSSVQLMRMATEKLDPEDILNITAYLASLPAELPATGAGAGLGAR